MLVGAPRQGPLSAQSTRTAPKRFSRNNRVKSEQNVVYAIVKAGGRQEKVAVGDKVILDRLPNEVGETIELEPVMVGDGDSIVTDAKKLQKAKVLAEVLDDEAKGPKISMVKYKNKTGYRKRIGHRQKLSVVRITEIA